MKDSAVFASVTVLDWPRTRKISRIISRVFFFLKSCSKIILVTWMAIIDRQSATRMATLEIATGTRFKVYRKIHLRTFFLGACSVTDNHWTCSLFFLLFLFVTLLLLLFYSTFSYFVSLYILFSNFLKNWKNWDIEKGDEIKRFCIIS